MRLNNDLFCNSAAKVLLFSQLASFLIKKYEKKEKDYPKEQGSLSHIINILKLSHINIGIYVLATY